MPEKSTLFLIGVVLLIGYAFMHDEKADPGTIIPNVTNHTNTTMPPVGGGGGGSGGTVTPDPVPTCTPSVEVCNAKDDDCDGLVDDGGVCTVVTPPPPVNSNYLMASPTYTSQATSTCTSRANSLATAPKDYNTVVDAMMNTPQIVQMIPCDGGTCMWVPWYEGSKTNAESALHRGDSCTLTTIDYTHNCMVTDEFSQVGMMISMTTNRENDFIAFMNTVKKIKGTKYGSLPVWRVSREGNNINPGYTTNSDSASDATARIIIALYTGSNNQAFSQSTRSAAKALADSLAGDMIKYEFTHSCKSAGKYGNVCHWLASGSDAGTGGFNYNMYSYGGYYGDVSLALLAAYKNTGNQLYLSYAQDVARTYLAAAKYDGSKLTVAPYSFNWVESNGVMTPVCKKGCTSSGGGWQWDDADAVRAVTMCKAQYYGTLNGVTLNKDLGVYCQQITQISCYGAANWCVQLYQDGTNTRASQGGVLNNGLGSSLNFYYKQADLQTKLNEIFNGHFGSGTNWDYSGQFGVYNHAFAVVNLGSATGRDTSTYGSKTSGEYCT